jgi:hypothetical protein
MLLIPTLLCPKPWEDMSGSETQRFCTYCKKHVHNLEAMSASERLALLSSPAASICSRYQVAIRRPVRGKEESYYLHLAKHGAGVALVGSVLLVLWELHGQSAKENYYRVAGVPTNCPMPPEFYQQQLGLLKGDVYIPPRPTGASHPLATMPDTTENIDLKIDPKILKQMFDETGPELVPVRPAMPHRH